MLSILKITNLALVESLTWEVGDGGKWIENAAADEKWIETAGDLHFLIARTAPSCALALMPPR